MSHQMIAIDLDGTLLDRRGEVSSANRRALDRANDAGMQVVLCTGRGLCEARGVMKTIDHQGPVILAGGALIWHASTEQVIERAVIETHLAAEVIDCLDPSSHAVLILLDPDGGRQIAEMADGTSDDEELSEEISEAEIPGAGVPGGYDYLAIGSVPLTANTEWWMKKTGAQVLRHTAPKPSDLAHALRIGIVGPPQVMPPIEARIIEKLGGRIEVQHFTAVTQIACEDIYILEVFAASVHKWAALKALAKSCGIDPAATVAIGDHINDVTMVENAGCGIAMGNAVDSVKAVSRYVTESNDDDGVARAIDRLLDGQWA